MSDDAIAAESVDDTIDAHIRVLRARVRARRDQRGVPSRIDVVLALHAWARDQADPSVAPTFEQWQQHQRARLDRAIDARMIRRLFGSWEAAMHAASLRVVHARRDVPRWSPADVIAQLQEWARRYRRSTGPTVAEWEAYRRRRPGVMGKKPMVRSFGSWNGALRAAGLEAALRLDPPTADEMVSKLRAWASERASDVGPTVVQWRQAQSDVGASQRVSAKALMTTFGSWPAALRAAGLTPPDLREKAHGRELVEPRAWW